MISNILYTACNLKEHSQRISPGTLKYNNNSLYSKIQYIIGIISYTYLFDNKTKCALSIFKSLKNFFVKKANELALGHTHSLQRAIQPSQVPRPQQLHMAWPGRHLVAN